MNSILEKLNIKEDNYGACSGPGGWMKNSSSKKIASINPATGKIIASVFESTIDDCDAIVKKSGDAYKEWRKVPAPIRGQLVREMAEALRDYKDPLGSLVALEMGKIKQEGDGEVQEMIDIADFAVGQSRMLYGKTMHSERPQHRMYEQWHPIGPVGVISAFNFPVAVWSWNAYKR
jgi:aldehyde dehydrogenase (NAD+)